MSNKERAVYSLFRAHFLAQFMPHDEFDRTVADFDCNQVALRAVGKRIEVLGWKTMFHVLAADDDEDSKEKKHPQILPPLQNAFRAKAQQAQPPKRYSEGDLIRR